MRNLSLLCLLFGTLWWAQAKPAWPILPTVKSAVGGSGASDDDEKQSKSHSAAGVPADAAVLTIRGLCAGQGTKPTGDPSQVSCQTVITRAEFEKLTGAIQPEMTPASKRQLASSYPRLLVMAHEAEQRGLDKQEHFRQMIAYSRLQILSQDLVHDLEQQATQVPEKDIEDYYHEHLTAFERATLERLLVPNKKEAEAAVGGASAAVSGTNNDKPGTAAGLDIESGEAMAKEAERLRARAAAGEDFAKLQRAAYDAAGVSAPIPTTLLVKWRHAALPAAHLSVFDLKPGEISAVFSDSRGHFIYKLDSKEMESLEEARAEIHNLLQKQRMRDLMKKVEDSATTEVNQTYFGSSAAPKAPDRSTFTKPDSDKD